VLLYSDCVKRRRGAAPGDGVVHWAADESMDASAVCPGAPVDDPDEDEDCPEPALAPSEEPLVPPPIVPTHAAPTATGMSGMSNVRAKPIRCSMRGGSFITCVCAYSGEPARLGPRGPARSPIFYEGRQRRCSPENENCEARRQACQSRQSKRRSF
jgi:hypothetical protein